jgi:hypothetical protein
LDWNDIEKVATQLARSTIQEFKIGHKTTEISKDFLCWDFPKKLEDRAKRGQSIFIYL